MPSGPPAATSLPGPSPAAAAAAGVTGSPAHPSSGSVVRPLDTLVHQGPHALLDAAASFAGRAGLTVAWLLLVIVATAGIRIFAQRGIAALTAALAAPDRETRARRALRRLLRPAAMRDRSAAALPALNASLVALAERRRQRARAIGSLASSLVSGALAVGVLLLIALRAGVPGSTLASAGVVGLGAAVLTQGLARDLLAGAFVLVEDTYGVGDFIDVGLGAAGVVEQIGLRTTRLRGPDGVVWHIRHSEMVRIGNRTQEVGLLQLDVTVSFPPPSGDASAGVVGVAELARAERLVRLSLDRLDRDLRAARRIGDHTAPEVPSTLAALVPELVADVSHTALRDLARVDDAALVDTAPHPGLADMLEELLEDADVPVLAETVVVGLVAADGGSVTLRVRARVADTSREAAAAVLRRRLFVDVTSEGLAVSFAAVTADPL